MNDRTPQVGEIWWFNGYGVLHYGHTYSEVKTVKVLAVTDKGYITVNERGDEILYECGTELAYKGYWKNDNRGLSEERAKRYFSW
jgi:surface antigen